MRFTDRSLAMLAVLIGVAWVAVWCVRVDRQVQRTLDTDFGVYYRAGNDFRSDTDLYNLDHGEKLTFKYAPVVAMASSALSYAPASTARILWLLGDILLIAGCLHLATRLVVPDSLSRRKRWAVAGLSFIAVYGHIVAQLHCGQSTSLWLFLTLCAFHGMIRGRPLASGCALAAAVLLKCVPICLVPYYFFTRRPVAGVTAFAVAMMIGLSIPATVRGWDRNLADSRDWVGHLTMSESLEQHSRLQNQSVLAQMIRWSPRQTQDVFKSARHYWILTSLLSGAILYAVIARTPHAHAAHLSGILIYVTVFNPFAWRYNFLALVVPYAFVIADVLASRRMVYSRALIVIAASAVSTLPLGDSVYVHGGRLWGALGLAVAVVLTAWRQHQQARGSHREAGANRGSRSHSPQSRGKLAKSSVCGDLIDQVRHGSA